MVVAASGSKDETAEGKKQEEEEEFNPFGFVTDNPSSRGAIQLPESPAQDGNVGQMLYVMPTSPHLLDSELVSLLTISSML